MAKVRIIETSEKKLVSFFCPGCNYKHEVPVRGHKAWAFNNDVDNPTLTPSILNTTGSFADPNYKDDPQIPPTKCHIFVRDGQIQFLADCTHGMKTEPFFIRSKKQFIMSINNSYPHLPDNIPFKSTQVEMPNVVIFGKTLIAKYGLEVVKAAYIIFRIEGANGLKGVNDNYIGLQADCGAWEGLDMTHIVGTLLKVDSGNAMRRFICFDKFGYQACFDFLCYKVKERGMYVGAPGVTDADKIDIIYKTKWNGSPYPPNIAELHNFESLYGSAKKAFG